ncbi:unnamed protein product [Phytophthora fragariaefolia]|uniref:Unnamed protein product n=1 Tax=Phytophthora fragariaefolia TaxID=1490495 RepID=A0A9W6XQ25_9STRA|nr:unnamed protein product [Phytophthora fragariaefolia]
MEFSAEELADLGVNDASELGLLLGQSLYGPKQAELLHETLLGFGVSQCLTDSCVYVNTDEDGITVVGTIHRGSGTHYRQNVGHGLENTDSVRLPFGTGEPASDLNDKLLPVTAGVDSKIPTVKNFQSLVGSLLWIAGGTRPDVMFAVHRATRRTHKPTLHDWKLAKRITRYLRGTRDLKLRVLEDAKEIAAVKLCCWTDADIGGEVTDHKSLTGVIVQVHGMPIEWQCKKQTAVALSTAEAELVAASIGG